LGEGGWREQIEEKRYADELEARCIRDIVLLGIAFAGKRFGSSHADSLNNTQTGS